MTGSPISFGQSRVVGFFVICCLLGALNTVRRSLAGGGISSRFVLVQFAFIIFAGSAAWYLDVSKSAGWYLSLLAVANWFAIAISATILFGVYAIVLTVGMVAVLIRLHRREVIGHFQVKLLTR